jgi:hypothetical protein
MPTLREQFRANLAEAEAALDAMLDELRQALADRDGWNEWELTWTRVELGDDHLPRTHLEIRWARAAGDDWLKPRFGLWCLKKNGRGQATDEARFATAAEALAWIEQPRSDTTLTERAAAEEDRRYANRDRVNIAGLVGRRTDAGRDSKDHLFRVVEFEEIGRVRITDLAARSWRVSFGRKGQVVTPAEGEAPGKAVRAAIEDLHRAVTS